MTSIRRWQRCDPAKATLRFFKRGTVSKRSLSACRKSLFVPLSKFSEPLSGLKTKDFNGAEKQAKRRRWRIKRVCFEEGSQSADIKYPLIGLSRRCIPSWVISALRAALWRLRSETRLRAQSRTHPLPARGMRRTARTVGTPLFISSFCPLGGGTGLFTKADFCYNRAKVSLCP